MKVIACWTMLLVMSASGAFASRNFQEDRSADAALVTWSDPIQWEAGIVYKHLVRSVRLGNLDDVLNGEIVDVAIGVNPWPWLLLYGQAGISKPELDSMRESTSNGAGGLLGARVNVWQLYQGLQQTSWRLTLQAAAQYAYRTGADEGDGDLQWGETLIMLPLRYHLTFARSFRNVFMTEFQSVSAYAGPAFSSLDGTWTRHDVEQDFEEEESFGIVGGVDLWLLENLSLGARVDWFESTSYQLMIHYRF